MPFASLKFSHPFIIHFRRTSFRILRFRLELQVFIIFGCMGLPIFFFFFLEIISSEFSLLIWQFLLSSNGSFDFTIFIILSPVYSILLIEFEVMALLPVSVSALLNVCDFGSVGYPGALLADVVVDVLTVQVVEHGCPSLLVPRQFVDALHVHCLVTPVHVPVFVPHVCSVALNVFLHV